MDTPTNNPVTTIEELLELPEQTIVCDREGTTFGWAGDGGWRDTATGKLVSALHVKRPATVIWPQPTAPTPMQVEAAAQAMYEEPPTLTVPKRREIPWEELGDQWKQKQRDAASRILQVAMVGRAAAEPSPVQVEAAAVELYGTHPFAPALDTLPEAFKSGLQERAAAILKAAMVGRPATEPTTTQVDAATRALVQWWISAPWTDQNRGNRELPEIMETGARYILNAAMVSEVTADPTPAQVEAAAKTLNDHLHNGNVPWKELDRESRGHTRDAARTMLKAAANTQP